MNTNQEILRSLKIQREVTNTNFDLDLVKKNISKTRKDIITTQANFDLKKSIDQNAIYSKLFELYSSVVLLINKNYKSYTWSDLFSRQLENVNSLNLNLAKLIYFSSSNVKQLEDKLFSEIDFAKKSLIELKSQNKELPNIHKMQKNIEAKLSTYSKDDIEYYDLLKEDFSKKSDVMTNLSNIGLLENLKNNNVGKIDFLKTHITYQKNAIFSAKKIAVSTNEICKTLEYLLIIEPTMNSMNGCLSEIYNGISHLREYTTNLDSLYNDNFNILQRLETVNSFNQFDTANVNGLINRQIDIVDRRLNNQ